MIVELDPHMVYGAAESSVRRALAFPGVPLSAPVLAEMEYRFDTDFSDVRIHTGEAAHVSAVLIDALAYTCGSRIVFQYGAFDPDTHEGKRLLAHELAHVVQQRLGVTCGASGERFTVVDGQLEHDAEASAERAMRRALPRNALVDRATAGERVSDGPLAGPEGILVVQRYHLADIPGMPAGNNYLISGDPGGQGNYVVEQHMDANDEEEFMDYLWVRDGVGVPLGCTWSTPPVAQVIEGKKYKKVEQIGLFLRDCAHTAEEIMWGNRLEPDQQHLSMGNEVSQVAGLVKSQDIDPVFGGVYSNNIKNAKAFKKRFGRRSEYFASPKVGQAFAWVECNWTGDPDGSGQPNNEARYPYHAAAVIAEDQDDRITLETSAGETDAEVGKGVRGIFNVYWVPRFRKTALTDDEKRMTFYNSKPEGIPKPSSSQIIALVIEPLNGIELPGSGRKRRLPEGYVDNVKRVRVLEVRAGYGGGV